MGTWEQRMSDRAKGRAVVREAEEAARHAVQVEESKKINPPVPGEDEDLVSFGPHAGHRTHPHYGVGLMCQCGVMVGVSCLIISGEGPMSPESCPVCVARGISGQSTNEL